MEVAATRARPREEYRHRNKQREEVSARELDLGPPAQVPQPREDEGAQHDPALHTDQGLEVLDERSTAREQDRTPPAPQQVLQAKLRPRVMKELVVFGQPHCSQPATWEHRTHGQLIAHVPGARQRQIAEDDQQKAERPARATSGGLST